MSTPKRGAHLHRDAPGRCSRTKADGTPCGQVAQIGKDVCFAHDDEHARERHRIALAAKKAQIAQMDERPDSRVQDPPTTLKKLIKTVGVSIEQVRLGDIDSRRAEAISRLAKVQLDLIQAQDASKKTLTDGDLLKLSDAEIGKLLDETKANAPS